MITVDFNRLAIRSGFKILDIGCGSGRHTAAAYELDRTFAVGADLNYTDVAQAGERLRFHDRLGAHGGGSWALSTADICNLPFKTASFDLVICSEVLEHIPDYEGALKEIQRILKPGGLFCASVQTHSALMAHSLRQAPYSPSGVIRFRSSARGSCPNLYSSTSSLSRLRFLKGSSL